MLLLVAGNGLHHGWSLVTERDPYIQILDMVVGKETKWRSSGQTPFIYYNKQNS